MSYIELVREAYTRDRYTLAWTDNIICEGKKADEDTLKCIKRVLESSVYINELVPYLCERITESDISSRDILYLGDGGYGSVYSSMNDDILEHVAFKIINSKDTQGLNHEYSCHKKASDIMISQGLDNVPLPICIHNDKLYMSRVNGTLLHKIIEHVSDNDLIRIIIQLFEVCWILESNGVKHNDMTIFNVICRKYNGNLKLDYPHVSINTRYVPVLLDFGLATMIKDGEILALSNEIYFNPRALSPISDFLKLLLSIRKSSSPRHEVVDIFIDQAIPEKFLHNLKRDLGSYVSRSICGLSYSEYWELIKKDIRVMEALNELSYIGVYSECREDIIRCTKKVL